MEHIDDSLGISSAKVAGECSCELVITEAQGVYKFEDIYKFRIKDAGVSQKMDDDTRTFRMFISMDGLHVAISQNMDKQELKVQIDWTEDYEVESEGYPLPALDFTARYFDEIGTVLHHEHVYTNVTDFYYRYCD